MSRSLLAAILAGWLAVPLPALAQRPCTPASILTSANVGVASGPIESIVVDLNGDGAADLVTCSTDPSTSSGALTVRLGQISGLPAGVFGPATSIPTAGTPFALQTADFNHDGHPDLVVANRALHAIQIFIGTGTGSFLTPQSFAAGLSPYELVVNDFNEDGVFDVAVANNSEAAVTVLIGTSNAPGEWAGSFAPPARFPTANLSLSIAAGDVNSDGITDLIATEYIAGTIGILLGTGFQGVGNGGFNGPIHRAAGVEPYDVATGDLNADGRLDVVVANANNGGIRVLLGSATGFFPVEYSYLAGFNCSGVAIGDLDGDGALDLVVSCSVDASVQILRGKLVAGHGDGTFSAPTRRGTCCFPVHVGLADLDGDSDLDVFVNQYLGAVVATFTLDCVADTRFPFITAVRDVRNDQGGHVQLTWLASSLDAAGGPVTSYRVWRQVPGALAAARAQRAGAGLRRRAIARPDGTTDVSYWEALATLPAQRFSGYGFTAPTPQDSLAGSNPHSVFFVTAATLDPDVFYDSPIDSGYSVDNLSPGAPSGLTASALGTSTRLHWLANPESDLGRYELHRGADAFFTPSEATRLTTLTGTEFVDAQPPGTAVYKLAAIDVHGNRGAFATLLANQVTGVGDADRPVLALSAPSPNPSHGSLEFAFSLAGEGRARLQVLDAQGRVVRTLLDGVRPAGRTNLRWDGRDASGRHAGAGLYWVRLETASGSRVQRFTRID